ncbi:MAG: hypothetical protein ACLQVD_12810 [Capsulimonadaceae bacterium]
MLSIAASGALYAKNVTRRDGILPRRTAVRRDRMLGLADYVHLSPSPSTPLVQDKVARGFPHVLFVFAGPAVLSLPEVAALPYNTKAWRTRAASVPVTDAAERDVLFRRYLGRGRLASLEILVKYGLSLEFAVEALFLTDEELRVTTDVLARLALPFPPATVDPDRFGSPSYAPRTLAAIAEYFARCVDSGVVHPPPDVEFD